MEIYVLFPLRRNIMSICPDTYLLFVYVQNFSNFLIWILTIQMIEDSILFEFNILVVLVQYPRTEQPPER